MTWLRSGDNAYLDPRITQARALRPDMPGVVLLVRGFMWSLASHAAQFKTEYFVNLGACWEIGQDMTEEMLDLCQKVGLLSPAVVEGLQGFRIIEDSDFVHIKSKEAIEAEKNRRNDNRDQNLKWSLVFRDGDTCRWCGKRLHWTGKVSNAKATLDHLVPGEKGTLDTMVVACIDCNSARQNDADGSWGRANPLQPVPERPYYSPYSRKWLVQFGHLKPLDEEQGIHKPSSGALSRGATPAAVMGSFQDESVDVIPGSPSTASVGSLKGDPAKPDQLGAVGPSADSTSWDSGMIPGSPSTASVGSLKGDPAKPDPFGSVGLSESVSSSCSESMIPGSPSTASVGSLKGDPGSNNAASEGLLSERWPPSKRTDSEGSPSLSPHLSPDSIQTRHRQGPPNSGLAGTGRDGTGRIGMGTGQGRDRKRFVPGRRRKRR